MSFFLLAKHSDERLELLSATLFPTRQDALKELSAITSSSRFTAWDAEVLLVDADSATPVLLMRPSEQSPSDSSFAAPTVSEEAESADDAFVAVADEVPVVEVDDAWADAVADTSADEEEVLRAALARTAAQMEAEGVGAPASDGEPEPELDIEPELRPILDALEPEAVESEIADEIEAEIELEPAAEIEQEPAGEIEPEPEPEIEPEVVAAEPAVEPERPSVTTAAEPMSQSAAPAWPWDAVAEPPAPPIVDLEKPDEGAPSEDDGDAAEAAVADTESTPIIESIDRRAPAAPPAPPVEVEEDAVEEAEPLPESDFILDLEPIELTPVPPGYEVSEEGTQISSLSCEDCVYMTTCPNKDERDPSSCGSFQWK